MSDITDAQALKRLGVTIGGLVIVALALVAIVLVIG